MSESMATTAEPRPRGQRFLDLAILTLVRFCRPCERAREAAMKFVTAWANFPCERVAIVTSAKAAILPRSLADSPARSTYTLYLEPIGQSCGSYFYARGGLDLEEVFSEIAQRIFTRLTQ